MENVNISSGTYITQGLFIMGFDGKITTVTQSGALVVMGMSGTSISYIEGR
ncbi:MAG: hypothetical protein AABY22_34795 [Nanoarchaeota archaeon]